MDENPILYVVLNKELNMSAGKAAAQAVHAAMMAGERSNHFIKYPKRTVIVLEGTTEQIKNLQEYLDIAGIWSDYYIDEGVNEVGAYSATALAVEPIMADDKAKREVFKSFSLFYEEQTATKAIRALSCVVPYSHRPWFVRLTLRWLRKQK